MIRSILGSCEYKEILQDREEYWNNFFDRFSTEEKNKGPDIAIEDIVKVTTKNTRKAFSKSLPLNVKIKLRPVNKSRVTKNKNNTQKFKNSGFLKSSAMKEKKVKRGKAQAIEKYQNNDEMNMINHRKQQNLQSESNFDIFFKKLSNVDLDKFLWVKDKIEKDNNLTVRQFLCNKSFISDKLKELSKELSEDEVPHYFRTYLKYIKEVRLNIL